MALVAPDASAPELEIARAEMEAAHLEVKVLPLDALPAGGAGELVAARAKLQAALEQAEKLALATRFDAARALVTGALEDAQATRWAGEPHVAQALGELLMVAAQCGDAGAAKRAAERFPELQLDPARWSPDLRAALAKARATHAQAHKQAVKIVSTPDGAMVWVDGAPAGRTPLEVSLARGSHALFALREGFLPAAVRWDGAGAPPPLPLAEVAPADRAGALRLAVDERLPPGPEELSRAAEKLDADALAVLALDPEVRAWVAGPGIAESEVRPDPARGRLAAAREAVAAAAAAVRAACAVEHSPPANAKAGAPLALKVTARGCVAKVRGEAHAGQAWLALGPLKDGTVSVPAQALPSSDRPYVLEYRLWGETARGRITDSLGTIAAPLRVPVEADRAPKAPPHWYRKWWVWTIVAVAAAGIAVGGVLLFYQPAPEVCYRTCP